MTKHCNKCNTTKDVTDFSKCKSAHDGLQGRCKACRKAMQQEYQQTTAGRTVFIAGKAKYREKDTTKQYERAYAKLYQATPQGKCAKKKGDIKFKKLNPVKVIANNYVKTKLLSGKLISPPKCEHCESRGKLQAHHHSYLQKDWLNVTWLCQPCHVNEHKAIRKAGIILPVPHIDVLIKHNGRYATI